MGHRLPTHQGKCRFPHGHNYELDVKIARRELDEHGFVMDFSELKGQVKQMLEMFDHAFLLWEKDPLVDVLRGQNVVNHRNGDGVPTKVVVMSHQPTAENISALLTNLLAERMPRFTVEIGVYETKDSFAKHRDNNIEIVEAW